MSLLHLTKHCDIPIYQLNIIELSEGTDKSYEITDSVPVE